MDLLHDRLLLKNCLQICAGCQKSLEYARVIFQAGTTITRRKNVYNLPTVAAGETTTDSSPNAIVCIDVANEVKSYHHKKVQSRLRNLLKAHFILRSPLYK